MSNLVFALTYKKSLTKLESFNKVSYRPVISEGKNLLPSQFKIFLNYNFQVFN